MTKKNFWSRWWLEVTSPLRACDRLEQERFKRPLKVKLQGVGKR
jgi:hypothetical protein